nr:InlB B-repeat-containing protein [Oscillospiraceae bacterium]
PEYHVCICGAGEPVAYKFVFNYTDEDGKTESSGTVSYGNTLSYWEPGFNREGYYVIWCSDEALTKEYDLETPVTAPVTLYAKWVQYYNLYIEGLRVDELNKDDILDDGTVSYDPTTNTLTLNNADIQGNDSDLWGGSYVGISYSDVENPLTLHLVGDNKVSALSDPSIHPTAIEISGSLTVTGDGNLTVTAAAAEGTYQEGAYGIRIDNGNATFQGTGTITANVTSVTKIAYMGGIWVGGDITVESGTVNAYANHTGTAETSGTADNVGAIYAEGNGNTVTINGGTVNAYSGTGYSETAAIGGGLGTNIVINGGTVTAVGGTGKTQEDSSVGCNSYGIGVGSVSRWNGETFVSEGGTVTINGGTVKATGGAASENSFGIGAEGGVTITGGEVTATGGTASVDSYGIGAGVETTGKVVISGGTVKATGGNATAASYGIGAKEGVEIAGTADVQASSGTGAVSYGIGTLGNVELENSIALEAQGGIMAIGAVKTATLEAGEYWLTVTNRDGITTHPARIESGDWTNLLYFKMEPGIPVYFDANGGAWGEEAIKAVQVEKSGDSVAKPGEDPVHSNGMVLKGWYDENGKLFDFSTPITQSITLTAKWGYQVTVYNEYGQADNITLSNTVAVPGEHFVTQVSATVGTGIKVTGIALDSDNPYWVGNRYFTFNKETKTLTIDAKFVTGDLLVEVVPYVTVKTHLNGGAVSEKWQYTYEADDDGVITVEWGIGDEGYLFPTWDNTANTLIDGTNEVFVREGHTVSAYNTASDGSGSNYETDEEFTFTQDTELYLIWKANEHTLTWIIDGVTTTEAVAYGAALTAPAAPADREGYTFTGWDGTIPDTMPNEDITVTLTSQWKANEYRVTLVADAVSGVSIDKTTATFGEDFTAIITVGNSAYELLSQHIYVTYADAEAADEENMLPFTYDAETGAFTIAAEYVTKDLRIEAVATEKTYTVILDFNGGMDANNHTTESTQIALGKETAISSLYCGALGLDGHELTGWNTEADGSGTQYGLTATVKSDVHNAVITLYAQWEAKEYKVTFNAPNVTITPMYGGDPDKANGDVAYMVNLTPAVGYGLPASIAVTVGGEPLSPMENHDPDTGYSYYMQEDGTANLIISANHITGDITVDVEAKLRTFTVTWTIDGETYATDSITYG